MADIALIDPRAAYVVAAVYVVVDSAPLFDSAAGYASTITYIALDSAPFATIPLTSNTTNAFLQWLVLQSIGSLNEALDDVTLTGTGTVTAQGSLAQTLADVTSNATGISLVHGVLSQALADLALTGTAKAVASGVLFETLADLTLQGTTEAHITGALHGTLDDVTLIGFGDLSVDAYSIDGFDIEVLYPMGVRFEGAVDPNNYRLIPTDGGAPLTILSIEPQFTIRGTFVAKAVPVPGQLVSDMMQATSPSFDSSCVGDYLDVTSPSGLNNLSNLRIDAITDSTHAELGHFLAVNNPIMDPLQVTRKTFTGVILHTTKSTEGKVYNLIAQDLLHKLDSNPFTADVVFTALSAKPRLESVELQSDGSVLVNFDQVMRSDQFLVSPDEYSIAGSTTVVVEKVQPGASPTQVVLITSGMGGGSYTLTVNATGTPHDVAGNPVDPSFNQAIFTGTSPVFQRSVFTDKGPIAKPPLVIQSGTSAAINDAITVTLPGASLNNTHVGLTVGLGGGSVNGGSFTITAVVSPTKVKVGASFTLPDPSSGSLTWSVYDPRDGQIADDPTDVVVRINGTPVAAEAVVGLLGQVILASAPNPTDDVKVDYTWVPSPTVDVRRLNSTEFRLNSWNREVGLPPYVSQHAYRYNNVLVRPSEYAPLDMQATLAQPKQRDLKYRAYERAYSALLNDPNLLTLNSPLHKIATPPLSRTIASTFVSYAPVVLPEVDPIAPWVRHGAGNASIVGDVLVVTDTTSGPFPVGAPVFWTRPIDLTFDHVFAATWRMQIVANPITQGVFSGVAAGYSDGDRAIVVGFLTDGGVNKIGLLKLGDGNDPSLLSSWAGGLDGSGNPTGVPVAFDWSVIHSYRLFRDRNSNVKVYLDGDVTETLRLTEAECPYLEELDAPFDALEGAFFGSLSLPATSTSNWDFYRYTILPTNPLQTAPSVFVSFEGTTTPELASEPWVPVGFAGTETIIGSSTLLLDSTSATTATGVGLVGGDFKGYARIEPLLAVSSNVVLDVNVQLRTFTHGITPNAVMAAVDDGDRLVQLSFIADRAAPKLSYGGHSFPDQFVPTTWSALGTQTASMVGHYLHISDSSTTDGLLYFTLDSDPITSTTRVVSPTSDYMLECRARVVSHTPDGSGFCGVNADVYDGLRSLGVLLREVAGVRYASLHSDGTVVAQFAFEWNDGEAHTYRVVKSTGGNLVSLFVDSVLLGTAVYSAFSVSGAGDTGTVTFGSATAVSVAALSVVEWTYANAWRVVPNLKHFVGLWKGTATGTLLDYHLPLKASGRGAAVVGAVLGDGFQDFVAAGVSVGDYLIIDSGANQGVYPITVVTQYSVTIAAPFPSTPSTVDYRIPVETDWTTAHRYRVVRDPGGSVAVLLDTVVAPLLRVDYSETTLPQSAVGIPRVLSGALPSICFGAFDPTNLSQTAWDFVRYGIAHSPLEPRIAPHHQTLNQRNVIASPEHLNTNIVHTHTDFWSSSTGIPPQIVSDLQQDPSLVAYTLLNEGTPLVPRTQTFEVRQPQVVNQPVSALNRPEDVLNTDRSFVLNDNQMRLTLLVPDDVLYNSLQVTETTSGDPYLLAPLDDNMPDLGTLYFQNETCLTYSAAKLPEQDTTAPTAWTLASDAPSHVNASVFGGVLTYGTDSTGTRTVYRNNTPLPDAASLSTQVKFRLKILSDSTGGTGDTQVRVGFSSAVGMTLSLGFVTAPTGERYVLVIDQNSNTVVGGQKFDFLDGGFHDYRIVKDTVGVGVFIDS